MENADAIRKIQGLLNKANDPGTTKAEAESLIAGAKRLMDKYTIDAALLAAKTNVKLKPGSRRIRVSTGVYAHAERNFAARVADAFDLSSVYIAEYDYSTGRKVRSNIVHVFGFEKDLDMYEIMYTSLKLQGDSEAVRLQGGSKGSTKDLRRGFWFGYARIIKERLLESRRVVVESSASGTDIVLRSRKDEVEAFLNTIYPKLRKAGLPKSLRSEAGYNAGQDAGRRANLHDRKAPSNTKRALT